MRSAESDLQTSGSQSNFPGTGLSILAYHGISSNQQALRLSYGLHLSKELFEKQCYGLYRHFDSTHADDYLARSPGTPSLLISFDDIYQNVFATALPILEHYKLKFIIFIATDFVDGELFWWDKLRFAVLAHPFAYIELGGEIYDMRSLPKREQSMFVLEARLAQLPASARNCLIDDIYNATNVEAIFGKVLPEFRPISLSDLNTLRQHPLCQVGMHSAGHASLVSLTPSELLKDLQSQISWCKVVFGDVPVDICYPFGDTNSVVHNAYWQHGFLRGYTLAEAHPLPDVKSTPYSIFKRYAVQADDSVGSLLLHLRKLLK